MDLEKQIKYRESAPLSDIERVEILIQKNKTREGLFFCHLSIEKMLKALYVKTTSELPPTSHNLFFPCEKSEIQLNDAQESLFGILLKFSI